MDLIEIALFLGMLIALWNLIPESKNKAPKFGEGLLTDTKLNRDISNWNPWNGF